VSLRMVAWLRPERAVSDIFVADLPGRLVVATLDDIRDRFRVARMVKSQRARWYADDPGAEPNTCRFCGKSWRKWAGSKLDGHAKCIVGDDFKTWLREVLRDPRLTYAAVAGALDLSTAIVRSWTFPIRSVRP